MKKRRIGKGGASASVVGFGGWAIGGWPRDGSDEGVALETLQAGIDAGVNFIDTAPANGFGLAESLVGKAIAGRARDELVIASKCGLRWDRESEHLHAECGGRRLFRTLAADSVREELSRSLERLGTDWIDLYQTHWPDPATDIGAVVDVMESLRQDGLIRQWGMCNTSADTVMAALATGEPSSCQDRYSLLDRDQESELVPLCREQGLAFLARSPLAQELLGGRIDGRRDFPEGDPRRDNPRFAPRVRDALQAILAPVKAVARDHDISTAELVLAWTLQQNGVTHILADARTPEQASANANAGVIELDQEELDVMQQAADAWPGFAALQATDGG
ncbi:MAG: aldo/keto reductase [Gammaproteobacteria bacterium]|nr:MAG: aldo/keto reductase [Gammaproteobacteria bacterium]PIE37389.1 MAG: aldo/keto reductase [Gammaproteobacteria bacterium]